MNSRIPALLEQRREDDDTTYVLLLREVVTSFVPSTFRYLDKGAKRALALLVKGLK